MITSFFWCQGIARRGRPQAPCDAVACRAPGLPDAIPGAVAGRQLAQPAPGISKGAARGFARRKDASRGLGHGHLTIGSSGTAQAGVAPLEHCRWWSLLQAHPLDVRRVGLNWVGIGIALVPTGFQGAFERELFKFLA